MLSKYAQFGRLIEKDKIYKEPGISYRTICRMIGVRPRNLDRLLRKELGMDGTMLIDIFRKGDDAPSGSC